jgi:hypothetical protein
MTQLLDQAIKEVSKLPTSEQDALACILLAEMASEKRWAESLAKAQDLFAKLAEDAANEYP